MGREGCVFLQLPCFLPSLLMGWLFSSLLPWCAGTDETEAVSDPPGDSSVHPICEEEQVSAGIEPPPQAQEETLLSEQLDRVQTMEDVEALATKEPLEEQEKPAAAGAGERAHQQDKGRAGARPAKKPTAKEKMISLQSVLSEKPREIQCPSLPVVMEEEVSGTGPVLLGQEPAGRRALTPVSTGGWHRPAGGDHRGLCRG